MVNRRETDCAVKDAMTELEIPVAKAVRWLGVDYGPGGMSSTTVRAGRLQRAKHRKRNIRGLKRQGVATKKVVDNGLKPALAYGSSAMGQTRGAINFIRAEESAGNPGGGHSGPEGCDWGWIGA